MPPPSNALHLLVAPLVLLLGCGSSGSGGGGSAGSGGAGGSGGSTTAFAGTYAATFTGKFQNTSPNTESGASSSSATITVSSLSSTEVELMWQVPPNPPSGMAVFDMSGSSGKAVDAGTVIDAGGTAVRGSCFTGIVNGNTQTNCCTSCSVTFSGDMLTQPNVGVYFGTTPQGVAYQGTYTGSWTGTRQ